MLTHRLRLGALQMSFGGLGRDSGLDRLCILRLVGEGGTAHAGRREHANYLGPLQVKCQMEAFGLPAYAFELQWP